MPDNSFKIELIKYLESVTLGSTESTSLEIMTTDQLDDLIRLCRVNPDDAGSMARAKFAMNRRYELRKELRKQRLKELRLERAAASNVEFGRLSPDNRARFVMFVCENMDIFSEYASDDFHWLDNITLCPSVDFWTGDIGDAVNEILGRLRFGEKHGSNIDAALFSSYTYDGVTDGPICSPILMGELDEETKKNIFWKYARARL